MSEILIKFKKREKVFEANGATGYRLSTSATEEYVFLEIEPSGFIAAHALPNAVDFFVVSGSGLVIHEDEEIRVEEGDIIKVASNSQRGWKNDTLDMLTIFVIKHKAS